MTKKNNGNPRDGAHIFSEAPVSQELLEKAKETGLL
jgi:hypothetical protein